MSYLDIDSKDVKLAGAGAKLQWGLVIGVAVDKIVGEKAQVISSDDELREEIKAELKKPGVAAKVGDPSKLHPSEKKVVDELLVGAGTKLTTSDLHKIFSSAP